jgi:hypothetical protein
MEDKRITKRSRSLSMEGSSSLSSGSTPPSVPPGSSLPPGSPSEISSHRPCSPVFEQVGPFEKVPVVDLSSSSDVEGPILDTSWDEEFARRLFGDLNHGVLEPPGDGKVIILSDSDKEEEVCEEYAVDAEAMRSPAPTASTDDVDDADKGRSPDWAIGGSSSGRDEANMS